MSNKLNLIPNEIVGYRIHPDRWNWTVVEVKKHGENSKNAGEEYETTLAYPRDIRGSIEYIVNYVSAIEGDKLQKLTFERTGVAADLESLKEAFEKAEKRALDALTDLEERMKKAGISFADLKKSSLAVKSDEPEVEDKEEEN